MKIIRTVCIVRQRTFIKVIKITVKEMKKIMIYLIIPFKFKIKCLKMMMIMIRAVKMKSLSINLMKA